MIIILFGAPGVGKGSVSQTLVSKYGFKHLSTGELIRHKLQSQATANGALVNDDYVNSIVIEALKESTEEDVVILDGFPRTKVQADFLASHCKIDAVFLLTKVSDEFITKRLSNRVLCKKHGHSFNLLYYSPKVPGVCDFDGSELYKRPDDEEEIIKKRLAIYREHTQPLLNYYKENGVFIEIDASRDMFEMSAEIAQYIEKIRKEGK